MNISLYQYSQLCCIVETLSFAFALTLIGDSKIKSIKWLIWPKRAIALVLTLVGALTLLQYSHNMSANHPNINVAVNVTILYATTFILTIAFMPIAYTTDKKNQMYLSVAAITLSTALVWGSTMFQSIAAQLMLVCSIAIYVLELTRITIIFVEKYKTLAAQSSPKSSEEHAQLSCLNLLVKGVVLLSLYAMLYAVLALWSESSMALFNFASLLLWGYLFVTFINVMMNYHYDYSQVALAAQQHQEAEQQTESSQQNHINSLINNLLNSKLNELINDKFYCQPGITMESTAQLMGTNRTYLSNFIKAQYGESFNTWLSLLRIDEAKHLLSQSPTLSLEQIAQIVGFSSKSHFMRTFKTVTGSTPGQWRQQPQSCNEPDNETVAEIDCENNSEIDAARNVPAAPLNDIQ